MRRVSCGNRTIVESHIFVQLSTRRDRSPDLRALCVLTSEILPFFKFVATTYFGVDATDDDVRELFLQIDDDFDAVINFAEFLFFCIVLNTSAAQNRKENEKKDKAGGKEVVELQDKGAPNGSVGPDRRPSYKLMEQEGFPSLPPSLPPPTMEAVSPLVSRFRLVVVRECHPFDPA